MNTKDPALLLKRAEATAEARAEQWQRAVEENVRLRREVDFYSQGVAVPVRLPPSGLTEHGAACAAITRVMLDDQPTEFECGWPAEYLVVFTSDGSIQPVCREHTRAHLASGVPGKVYTLTEYKEA